MSRHIGNNGGLGRHYLWKKQSAADERIFSALTVFASLPKG